MNRILFYIIIVVQLFSIPNLLYSNASKSEQLPYCNNSIELLNSLSLDLLIENVGDRKLVLLGESTHGTAEFYHWRAEISKRLIKEKGFSFIVVEGDWASIYKLNLYVKGLSNEFRTAREVLVSFNRWPEWMWANTVIEGLAEWLKEYNTSLSQEQKVGFYGMDVYGQWEAMDEVLRITQELMPEEFPKILEEYNCYTAYNFDEWQYARAVQRGYPSCFEGLNWVVEIIREHLESSANPIDRKLLIHAKQSAMVVKNSEDYYRLAVRDNITSWNSRVMHMHKTVGRLLEIHGSSSKGIVWAHNTHIGDARATSMRQEGMLNIGQLSRELHSETNVTLIGFTTYKGRVNAGARWGALMSRMHIPEAQKGSAESILKKCDKDAFYTIFDDEIRQSEELLKPIGHRAIGVVFNPATERMHNYVPTILPLRYDAIVFIKKTTALEPVKLF
jgi:erythromycin esterase